jgi:hypothetical protein
VIFTFDPEDRHRRDIKLVPNVRGKLDGRNRLEQREHRPAEQRRLLAGDDRDGPRVTELGSRVTRRLWSTTPALLRLENRDNGVTLTRMLLRAADRGAPRRWIRGAAREELGHTPIVVRVIGRELPDPGKPSNVDREAHGGVVVAPAGSRAHRCRG